MWPNGFSIRLIGKEDCYQCNSFRKYLDQAKYPYEFYDATKPENQKQLDEWMVVTMPVIQVLKDGKKVHQFSPGIIVSTLTILGVMRQFGASK